MHDLVPEGLAQASSAWLYARSARYGASDITTVIGLRVHAGNPWVTSRLRMLAGYYDPMPGETLIVDLGSEEPYAAHLRSVCEEAGFRLLRLDDDGVYSAAVARNRGSEAARTDLVFFNDIDCFGDRDLFARLAKHANAIGLAECFDRIVDLPAYFLCEQVTWTVYEERHREPWHLVERALALGVQGARGDVVDYVDPFSNVFMCRRDYFSFSGGYNETFRGHGSEDYEFILRTAHEARYLPFPKQPLSDKYAPGRNEHFATAKRYEGFRRLGELLAHPSEAAGLRVAHLHHPRGASDDSWHARRDEGRKRFHGALGEYFTEPVAALRADWLQRDETAWVITSGERDEVDAVMPLRTLGYGFQPVVVRDVDDLYAALGRIQQSEPSLPMIVVGSGRGVIPDPSTFPAVGGRAIWFIEFDLHGSGEVRYQERVRESTVAEWTVRYAECAEGGILLHEMPGAATSRTALVSPFGDTSYASGKLQLGLCRSNVEAQLGPRQAATRTGVGRCLRLIRKAQQRPLAFLMDSKFRVVSWVGTALFKLRRRSL